MLKCQLPKGLKLELAFKLSVSPLSATYKPERSDLVSYRAVLITVLLISKFKCSSLTSVAYISCFYDILRD